eukprot:6192885-Pleurochrysis_carterae.AAC.1
MQLAPEKGGGRVTEARSVGTIWAEEMAPCDTGSLSRLGSDAIAKCRMSFCHAFAPRAFAKLARDIKYVQMDCEVFHISFHGHESLAETCHSRPQLIHCRAVLSQRILLCSLTKFKVSIRLI